MKEGASKVGSKTVFPGWICLLLAQDCVRRYMFQLSTEISGQVAQHLLMCKQHPGALDSNRVQYLEHPFYRNNYDAIERS